MSILLVHYVHMSHSQGVSLMVSIIGDYVHLSHSQGVSLMSILLVHYASTRVNIPVVSSIN